MEAISEEETHSTICLHPCRWVTARRREQRGGSGGGGGVVAPVVSVVSGSLWLRPALMTPLSRD